MFSKITSDLDCLGTRQQISKNIGTTGHTTTSYDIHAIIQQLVKFSHIGQSNRQHKFPTNPAESAFGFDHDTFGIDAGGTRTVALLADASGHVLGEAHGGRANLQIDGEREVERVLSFLLDELAGARDVTAVCLGGAGVDRPADSERIRGVLSRLGLGGAVSFLSVVTPCR